MKDLIYLDFDKAASIWSQIHGGLRKEIEISGENRREQNAGVRFGIPGLADAKLGSDYEQKNSTLESRVLHHDIITSIEAELRKKGLVSDLTPSTFQATPKVEDIRSVIIDKPYICSSGRSFFEDYKKIEFIAGRFLDLTNFIKKSAQETIKQNPEYQALVKALGEKKKEAKALKDRNEKATELSKIKEMETKIQRTLESSNFDTVDKWVLDGIKLWIETFMPNRLSFRVFPIEECPSFQVICNLKHNCFVDQDLEHLMYCYGNQPNVPLTVFGLITSIPDKEASDFSPMKEFDDLEDLSKEMVSEKAYRNIFQGLEGLEKFVKFSRYPNVTVHPIAVYRSIEE